MVSVVIPAYNEEKEIEKCLEVFLRQTTSDVFEIILVDNNCTDNTVKKAKAFVERLNDFRTFDWQTNFNILEGFYKNFATI